MLYVARNREIIFNWYLYEGTNKRVVDFTEIPGCRPTAFLVNKKGQYTYRLEYQFDASAVPFVRIVIPKDSLAPDIYDMKIIWEVPEEKDIRLRLRHNNRFLAVSHIAGVMKVTANIAEDNTGLPVGQTLVRTVKSLSESFGYDGLSAYELAVLRKGYTGTEEEYITQFERVPLYRTADTDNPDDERALSSLRAYRDLVEKDKVVGNADIDEQDTEDTSRVPSAYALRYVKSLITPISDLQGVGVLSKTASGWAFTQFPEGLQLGEDSGTAYAGDKGKKNREDIDALQRRVDELPDTVASKEELKAVEDKIDRKVKDLNQQVTGVGKDVADKASISDLEELRDYVSDRLSLVGSDVADKASISDLEELRDYVSDRLSPVGSDVRPIYIDEDGTKEVNGIVVPKDIISLDGGVAAKGIVDFGISNGTGGSNVTVTPLTNEGKAIAQIEVDGNTKTIFAPNPDISSKVDKTEFDAYRKEKETEFNDRIIKDQEHDTAISALQNLFTEEGRAKDADKLDGRSIEELFDSLDANEGINIAIGGVEKTLTKSELLLMLGFVDTGKHNQPVYYEDEELKVIDSLRIGGSIESLNGGVSAKGITDFGTPSGAGGTSGPDVLRDEELESLQSESITQVASAWSVKKIRDIINIDLLPKFSSEVAYVRGDVVVYNGEARQFTQDKAVGSWRSGITRPYDISAIATPLAIEKSWLKSVCEKQFGTTLN